MVLCAVIPDAIAMMISLNQIGKRFSGNWIFKGVNFTFEQSGLYGILGHNGSGKSTLMRIIGGMQNATVGKCIYQINHKEISEDKVFSFIAYCAPGMELIEEMNLKEFLQFHFSFKPLMPGWTIDKLIALLKFEKADHKLIHEYSSGMKQRVKLVQAFFADTPVLLLDEPCSNLDDAGVSLYQQLLAEQTKNRLVLVASNDEREYPGAKKFLRIADYFPENNKRSF